MRTFASVGIVFLVLLIQTFLQLIPGLFAIFYHNTSAKKSVKKADDLSLNFLAGVEIFAATIFVSIYIIFSVLYLHFPDFFTQIFPWMLAGILFALSVIVFLIYYRPRQKSTALFISRRHATKLITHAESVKTRTDAFALGAFSGVLELWLTIPLCITCIMLTILTLDLNTWPIIILYILCGLLPLFFIHALYHAGHNLASLERLRIKNKPLVRLVLSLSYLFLSLLLILLEIS